MQSCPLPRANKPACIHKDYTRINKPELSLHFKIFFLCLCPTAFVKLSLFWLRIICQQDSFSTLLWTLPENESNCTSCGFFFLLCWCSFHSTSTPYSKVVRKKYQTSEPLNYQFPPFYLLVIIMCKSCSLLWCFQKASPPRLCFSFHLMFLCVSLPTLSVCASLFVNC